LELEDNSMHDLDEEPLPSPTQFYLENLVSQRDEVDFAAFAGM
jgi:hypothetical protein